MKEWLDELAESGEYGNPSDIIRLALYEFKEKLEEKQREQQNLKDRILYFIRQNPELREAILKEIEKAEGEKVNVC